MRIHTSGEGRMHIKWDQGYRSKREFTAERTE